MVFDRNQSLILQTQSLMSLAISQILILQAIPGFASYSGPSCLVLVCGALSCGSPVQRDSCYNCILVVLQARAAAISCCYDITCGAGQ